ncbi:MAG: pentapeptide repeat-containing protein [Candidatus Melainabacteria bacterium]|nr:pentapeptide repeat-containing protein [Candidatus Melainabacteria bacterium]
MRLSNNPLGVFARHSHPFFVKTEQVPQPQQQPFSPGGALQQGPFYSRLGQDVFSPATHPSEGPRLASPLAQKFGQTEPAAPAGSPDDFQWLQALNQNADKANPNAPVAIPAGSNLNNRQLQGSNLHRAQLNQVRLQSACLAHSNLSQAQLQQAQLQYANLQGVDLREANLRQANLQGANLHQANLAKANLSGANLQNADLSGADLTHAQLNGANLSHTRWNSAILDGTQLSGAKLNGADFKSVAVLQDVQVYNYGQQSHYQTSQFPPGTRHWFFKANPNHPETRVIEAWLNPSFPTHGKVTSPTT